MTLPEPKHFRCDIKGGIARIAHDRPDRKNPFTFDSYAELRDWFRALAYSDDVHAVLILPNGGNMAAMPMRPAEGRPGAMGRRRWSS